MIEDVRLQTPEFASELERLLQCHEAAAGFLDAPASLPASASMPRALNAGDILADRFLIEQFLGAGGFGEVYLALDQELHRRIAIKTLRPEYAGDASFIARMKDEIVIAQTVSHPNLCRLYDFGSAPSGVQFLTMEWIAGPTLSSYIAQHGPVPESVALPMARQILSGLAALHAHRIVHRDLKSGNVMLAPECSGMRAVITDFGLARLHPPVGEDTLTLLRTGGWAIGTPAYMAPELLRGKAASIASDLHAIGVLLFELRTGRLPFEGASPLDIAMARLEWDAPRLRAVNSAAGVTWDRAVAACLHRDPAARPASAADVLAIIEGRASPVSRRSIVLGGAVTAAAAAAVAVSRILPGPAPALPPAAARSMELGAMFLRDRNKQSLTSAVEEFSKVTRDHPGHAPAFAGLAEAYSSLSGFGYMDTREALRLATEAGRRALELEPADARVLTVYAHNLSINVRRWLEATAQFEKAAAIDADDPRLINWYATHLGRLGRFDEAVAMLERGARLYPTDLPLNQQLATEYFRARKFDRFEAAARESARLFYDKPLSRLVLARALEWTRKFDEAAREIDEAERLGREGQPISQRLTLAAARGDMATARAFLPAVANRWEQGQLEAMQMAVVYAAIGDPQKAIAALDAGFDREDSSVLYAPTNPYLAGIRHTPDFVRFARRLGLPR